MDIEDALLRVQTAYPRIYLACHSRHQNARTTEEKLSTRDGTLLAHLSERHPTSQSDLARHLGVAKSTLSEALSKLEEQRFVARQRDTEDGRGTLILRTREGAAAMSGGSVLQTPRLRRLLNLLTADERRRAVEGLELLARAARDSAHKEQE